MHFAALTRLGGSGYNRGHNWRRVDKLIRAVPEADFHLRQLVEDGGFALVDAFVFRRTGVHARPRPTRTPCETMSLRPRPERNSIMFRYNVKLALKSMRRNPIMTGLMVAAIAVGIGVSMTTLTVYYMMSSNPIPAKSDLLFAVTIDSWNPLRPFEEDRPERGPHQLTFHDAERLVEILGDLHRQLRMRITRKDLQCVLSSSYIESPPPAIRAPHYRGLACPGVLSRRSHRRSRKCGARD